LEKPTLCQAEKTILEMMLDGYDKESIKKQTQMSHAAFSKYQTRIFRKFQTGSLRVAAKQALNLGLIFDK